MAKLRPEFEDALRLFAQASRILVDQGYEAPILVGGAAVELFSNSALMTGDFDVSTARQEAFEEALRTLGFVKPSGRGMATRGWVHPDLRLGFEVVSSTLLGGLADRQRVALIDLGNDGVASAYITRLTTAINGIVYKGEMICVEVPTTGDPDINLTASSESGIAEDQAGEGQHVLINGGVATLAAKNDITIPSGGIVGDYLYLTHGGTTAGTYNAGQFIIKLYGAATL